MAKEPDLENPFAARLSGLLGTVRVQMPARETTRSEIVTGLSTAIAGVPDGMAGGVLANVNPIYGLYAAMIGPLVGAFFTGTQLMRVTSTSASALAAGAVLLGYSTDQRDQALFLLVVLIGIVQLVAGLLQLGRLTRFVSHSVMVGFLNGIAVLIVLGQIGNFLGYDAVGPNKVAQAMDALRNIRLANPYTTFIGVLTLILTLALMRTKLRAYGALIALAVPSLIILVFGWDTVELVKDISTIPRGIPLPQLPTFSLLNLDLITAALAIAAVIVVQGAGVSQTVPNPDGEPANMSRDFAAEGIANIAVGMMQGVPVGGSVNQTAFSILAGARSRWTAIFSGLWMALILIVAPGLLGYISMSALAALLIIAGVRTIRVDEAVAVWQVGWPSRLAIVTTFVATLYLPIQFAVGIGAVLSALLYLNQASMDIELVELIEQPDGSIERRPPPTQLPSNAITVLNVQGSLFYAGARTLEQILPSPRGTTNAVVILRMHGPNTLGATLVDVLARYAEQLHAAGGELYLTGLSKSLHEQMMRAPKLQMSGLVNIYEATNVIGESSRTALADVQARRVFKNPEASLANSVTE